MLNALVRGGGQPQTCFNLLFGDGENGQIKNFEIHVHVKRKLPDQIFILTIVFVYSNLKISTGDAIWASVNILSYSMASLTEILTSVKHVVSWCFRLIYLCISSIM